MLVAVVGLSGAGKTTAVEYLASRGYGRVTYAGGLVLDEIDRRCLPPTAENEKLVRNELRENEGRDVLAVRVLDGLESVDENVLVDAVCLREEADCYRTRLGEGALILGISAPFDVRAERLAKRPKRPLNIAELSARDKFEIEKFGLEGVLAAADHLVTNDSDLETFAALLDQFAVSRLRAA